MDHHLEIHAEIKIKKKGLKMSCLKSYSSSNHGSVENGSLEDEFLLYSGSFPLP